jgi:hypothetical protein
MAGESLSPSYCFTPRDLLFHHGGLNALTPRDLAPFTVHFTWIFSIFICVSPSWRWL